MPNVSNLIKTIQDIMRKDAGVDGDAQRLAQLGWMFFLKIFDDREKEMEVLRDKYKSPLPKELRWSNWATDEEGITGDALLAFANNDLLPKLKILSGSGDIVTLIKAAFDAPPLTRKERADNVKKRNVFAKYGDKARAVLDTLLQKYADSGIKSVESLEILKVDPLTAHGTPVEIVKLFGGRDGYLAAIRELETALYQQAA